MANPHPEPHPENLKNFKKGDKRTVESARKGQKKSVEVQAQKRSMREWAVIFGQLPLKDGKLSDPKNASEIKDSNLTMDAAIIANMYAKASKGDVRAAEFLAKLKAQMADQVEIKVDPLSELSADELIKLYESTRPKKA